MLALLSSPTDRERQLFTSFTTTTNAVVLHTDGSLLPSMLSGMWLTFQVCPPSVLVRVSTRSRASPACPRLVFTLVAAISVPDVAVSV